MPILRPSGSDFTSFVKAAAQYVAPGRTAKVSKSGGVPVALPGLGAIVRASQVGALASPTTSAVIINGVTPPPSGGVFPPSVVATGGTITTTGGRRFHTFLSSGTFSIEGLPAIPPVFEIMLVGGGGAGATAGNPGGGGAGNLIVFTNSYASGNYPVVIGNGGVGGVYPDVLTNSQNSTFNTTDAIARGGGAGGSRFGPGAQSGGCGGGASSAGGAFPTPGSGVVGTVTVGTVVQNLATSGGIGAGVDVNTDGGGGGGGAGAAGAAGVGSAGGKGGDGFLYYGTYYAGGGGGGAPGSGPFAAGGLGGGGRGYAPGGGVGALPGSPNTGGGGGGGGFTGKPSGGGGSGICIVSYVYP